MSGQQRKRHSTHIRPGNLHLKRALVEAANSASHKKNSYLRAKYRRLAGRKGKKRAMIAVARTILQSIYYMMNRGENYKDLGENYYDLRNPERVARRLSKRIEKLGYRVQLEPIAQAA